MDKAKLVRGQPNWGRLPMLCKVALAVLVVTPMMSGHFFGESARGLGLLAVVMLALATVSCERGTKGDPAAGSDVDAAAAEQIGAGDPAESPLSEVPDTVPPPPPEPVKMAPVVNKDAEVSILGYHDFTDGDRRTSEMVIHIDDFREQMQAIKNSELPVISMQSYLAWRRGEEAIPEQCVMITIDDGWKATHTLALPVLREFGYPFTIFLYKKYVVIGGRSLRHDEVRELMAGGATVGSHSVSHQNMISRRGKGDDEYDEWLRVELEDSHQFLVDTFGNDGEVLKVFAYPFGIYSDHVVEKAKAFGYEAAFTVNGKKTKWDTPELEVGRYIVYGKGDQNFSAAMKFRGGGLMSSGRLLMQPVSEDGAEPREALVTTYPKDGEAVTERRPVISMDVSKLEGVDPDSIDMRVTGFGRVQHDFDPGSGVIRYQLPMSLRAGQCGVQVRLRHAGKDGVEEIAWNFELDRIGSYLDGIDPAFLPGDDDDSSSANGDATAAQKPATAAAPRASAKVEMTEKPVAGDPPAAIR